MSREVAIRNLQIITALDSLSYGLIQPFLSPYIIKIGGHHVTVGFLAVGNLLGDLLSPEVIKIFTHLHGKRRTLYFILNTAMITHIMLVSTNSYWFTILTRILFSLTNQTQYLCNELLINKAQNEAEKEKLRTNYSVLSGSGFILGPIISGYLFDRGFGYTGILAAVLTFINIILLMSVRKDSCTCDANPEHTEQSVLEKSRKTILENIQTLRKSNYQKNWDLLLGKYCFASSVLIFFSKFSQILKHNYHSGSVIIGYTTSYINILIFAATYYVAIFQSLTEKYPAVFLSELAFFLLAVLVLLACYAPYYALYMLFLVPIIFIRTFIMSSWKELYSERKDEYLNKVNNCTSVLAGLTTPLFFGIVCNRIAHHAVILFSFFPVCLCWIITRMYSKSLKIESDIDVKEKES